jgi:hypothetical protein
MYENSPEGFIFKKGDISYMSFKMDDGITPRDLKIDIIREGLRDIRKRYLDCVSLRKKEICYAIAANELMFMFGSLMPRVIHDPEVRYYILHGVDQLLIYDADTDRLKLATIEEVVNAVFNFVNKS